MSQAVVEHRFEASEADGCVTGVLMRPSPLRALYVFGHGAGAGMRHPFMEAVAIRLADRGIASFRFNFPYMEAGRRAPNSAPRLQATVRSAVAAASTLVPDVPLLAGGKSMGGRMASSAAAEEPLPRVRGIAFFGFPLHAAGRPSADRGRHLAGVSLPMLFLQGDRDRLADLDLLEPVLASISPAPTLHVVEGADHGFHVLKRSGRTDGDVLDELCDQFSRWVDTL